MSWELASLKVRRGWGHLLCSGAVAAWCLLGAYTAPPEAPEPTPEPEAKPARPVVKRALSYAKLTRPEAPNPAPLKAPKVVPEPPAPKPPEPPKPSTRAKIEKPAPQPSAQKPPAMEAPKRPSVRPAKASKASAEPVQVRIQSSGWGRGAGPVVSVELPGSSAGLKAFSVAHGAGFALSRRVSGNRAKVVSLLAWRGGHLVARAGNQRPAWLSWTPRLLVDPSQLRNIGHPAAKEGDRRLLTQIFIRGGALKQGVEAGLRSAGLQGASRAALMKAAAGRPMTCRGHRDGTFECRLIEGRRAP